MSAGGGGGHRGLCGTRRRVVAQRRWGGGCCPAAVRRGGEDATTSQSLRASSAPRPRRWWASRRPRGVQPSLAPSPTARSSGGSGEAGELLRRSSLSLSSFSASTNRAGRSILKEGAKHWDAWAPRHVRACRLSAISLDLALPARNRTFPYRLPSPGADSLKLEVTSLQLHLVPRIIAGNNPLICTANKEQECNRTEMRRSLMASG